MLAGLLVPGIDTTIVRLELTALAVACVLAWDPPQFGTRLFAEIERRFLRFAERRRLASLSVGVLVLALRVALLPVAPVAVPGYHDEFSYLLAADTFAHGRLANPTHPMWAHFESFHITQRPTYASMYPPLQGIVLAGGKVIFGRAWIGEWIAAAAMCAAITWMLQGWLAPGWALLGGLLATLRIATFSYWINTYFGGALGALGGALLIGSLPRIVQNLRRSDAVLLIVGIGVMLNTRRSKVPSSQPVDASRWRGSSFGIGCPATGDQESRHSGWIWTRNIDDRDDLLQLASVRESVHSAIQREPSHLRDFARVHLSEPGTRAVVSPRSDAKVLSGMGGRDIPGSPHASRVH
jgi:hypothetical protein